MSAPCCWSVCISLRCPSSASRRTKTQTDVYIRQSCATYSHALRFYLALTYPYSLTIDEVAQQKFNIRLALRSSFVSFVASRHCILVVRHISLTSCTTISPRGLYAHPLLISYLFGDMTHHLDPVLSASQQGRINQCSNMFGRTGAPTL